MASFDPGRLFAEQLARPRGLAGRLLGGAMDMANRKPMRLAIDLLAPQPDERILDAGCGSGHAMAELLHRTRCRVTGVDRSSAMVSVARRRLGRIAELHVADVGNMPFADESFDAILALNVLYFCDSEHRMLAELRRMLRPGGRLVAYVTHRQTMERWSFARKGLHRLFDEKTLVDALIAGGFAAKGISVHSERITRSVVGLLAFARC